MLKIHKLSNSNTHSPNFKSKNDYSQIYKEMEKITLRRDEKIIPKFSQGENFLRIKEDIGGIFGRIKTKIRDAKIKRNIKKQNAVLGFNKNSKKNTNIFNDFIFAFPSTYPMLSSLIKGSIVGLPIGTILGLWSIAAIEGQSLYDYLFNDNKQPTEIKNDKPDKLETDSIKQSETPKPALTPRWI